MVVISSRKRVCKQALGRVDRANGDKIRMLLAKNVDQLKNNMMGEVMPFLAGNSLLQDANRLETGATVEYISSLCLIQKESHSLHFHRHCGHHKSSQALARAAAWSAEDMTTTHRAHEQMDALLLATLASSSSERLSRVIRTALAHGDTAGAVAAYRWPQFRPPQLHSPALHCSE